MDRQLIAGETRDRERGTNRKAPSAMKEQHNTARQMQRALGNDGAGMIVQTKLSIGAPGDRYEQEADRVADQVVSGGGGSAFLSDGGSTVRRSCAACAGGGGAPCPACDEEEKVQRMPAAGSITPIVQREAAPEEEEEVQRMPAAGSITPIVQREAAPEEEEEMVQGKESPGSAPTMTSRQEGMINNLRGGGGAPLSPGVRAYMEPRFGYDFSGVRLHTDGRAAESARAIGALAYTIGRDVVFDAGMYNPDTAAGKRLLAHELTHVVQQGAVGGRSAVSHAAPQRVQRKLGDGHDLTSPRFSKMIDLEAVYDKETTLTSGSSGRGVQAIQQSLYDIGFTAPKHGADGQYGTETVDAVKAFQKANPPLVESGKVDADTMAKLDARFPAVALPAGKGAAWTESCVRAILCPWSPHTIDVIRSRITLKSFDSISWADEEWDGASWVPAPFPGGGYNTGTEIGVLNSNCEPMAETLYHEVLHAEQPTAHNTTLKKEAYAYRIGEEFSIAMGLKGRASLRKTDAQKREFADPKEVNDFVTKAYPSVPKGGGGDQIIGKAAGVGQVEVQRPDGTTFTRAAASGEKVPGPMTTTNPKTHAVAGWTCP